MRNLFSFVLSVFTYGCWLQAGTWELEVPGTVLLDKAVPPYNKVRGDTIYL